jgi:cell volume regulation protein A
MLLAFIGLGMIFGSDGIFKIPFDNYNFAEAICSTALLFILFYGGFGTKWDEAKPVAVKAILLSTLGVIFTAGLVGTFCYFVLNLGFFESFLIGSIISSTDAASVFSILRSKRLNLRLNTASLLEIESGSNDPFAYMLTIIILSIMNGNISKVQLINTVFSQITFGIFFGIPIAFASLYIIKRIKFSAIGFDAAFVLAIAILAYALPASIGGNGYLSTYIVGIILGNNHITNKKALIHFFDGIMGLMQMLIFFLLGLLAFPSRISSIFLPAFAISVFLTFIARPISIFALLTPFKCKLNQIILVSWTGLRGAASIVFAMIATIHPAYISYDIFHIILFIVLFSIAIQGTLLPIIAKKINMIDDNENVLKTFSDYSEEVPVQFINLLISNDHPWKGKTVKNILLPPDTLFVLLIRNHERIIPNGKTTIFEGDRLILSAQAIDDEIEINLMEQKINNLLEGKQVSELRFEPNRLIIMVRRNGDILIPNGETILLKNDVLVINNEM